MPETEGLRRRNNPPKVNTEKRNDKLEAASRDADTGSSDAGGSDDLRNTFWLTRVVFLRALAFIYFVAFLVALHQNKELIGDRGLLPVKLYLGQLKYR